MKALSRFEAIASNEIEDHQRAVLPAISAPAQQISRIFEFQSYFDDALLHNALLQQLPNETIIDDKEEQIPGYAVGLHPSSQTPVAIEFRVGAQKSSSAPLVLKPGQFIRPYGIPTRQREGAFSGFRWGVPFGWLGGGLATLVVFQSPDAYTEWNDHEEIIFHRARHQIVAPGAVLAPPALFPHNWPLRFPWTQARRGSLPVSQIGDPSVGINPTRTLMSLRLDTLLAPADMRVYWQGSEDFGTDSTGAIIPAEAQYLEMTWGTRAPYGLAGITEFEFRDAPSELNRIAADDGGVALVSNDVALQGAYVDIVRYGRM